MEKEVKEKLEIFLTKSIDEKSLAQSIRRFMHETIRMLINAKDEDFINKDWISDGHYYLTELCEILDPNLEN
ncbi:MAG: hypothetical protein Q4A00_05695 [Flavobacteriaceae bacterium]|nr:hypothetical protein [Flavobacteriaceae bacterium]